MADWISLLGGGPDPAASTNESMAIFQQAQDRAQQQAQQQQAARLASQQATATAAYRGRLSDLLRTGDTSGAAAAAFAAGDDKAGTGFTTLSKQNTDRAAAGAGAFGDIVRSVASLPYEQRAGAIQSAKPTLTAMGYDGHAIDGFDPTDANLSTVGGLGYSMKDRIGDETAQYNAETQRLTATNPVVVGKSLVGRDGTELFRAPEYQDVDPTHNLYQIPGVAPGASAAPDAVFGRMIGAESGGRQMGANGQPVVSPKGAIGIAQVMPSTAPEAARLAGLPFDEGRYRTDPAYNMALGKAYFGSLVQRYGGDTAKAAAAYNCGPGRCDAAIARGGANWQANLPAETRAYVAKVAGPQQTTTAPKLVQTGQAKADDKDPESQDPGSVDMLARQYLITGQLPPMGQGGSGLRRAVYNAAASIAKTNNWSAADLANHRATYKSETSNLGKLQNQLSIAQGSENTAMQNGRNYLEFSAMVPHQTRFPLVNGVVNGALRQTGNADIQRADSAYQTFVTEYAKVVTASPTGSGQLSDSARHENMAILNSDAAPAQKKAALEAMQKDMDSRLAALQGQVDASHGRINALAGSSPAAVPRQQARPAPSANAVAALRAKPGLAAAFDQRFGQGASARVLGH